jgi:Putative peptidoglycan binding domain
MARRRTLALALALAAITPALQAGPALALPPGPGPMTGDGMWIWQMNRSSHGNLAAIGRRAASRGIDVIVIKAADGTRPWRQFTPQVVSALKSYGLKVCGYQFIYGRRPRTEARVGAGVVARGASCLLLDAEGTYEGRYAQAQAYLRSLRARIGPAYPVGLASFPYVSYHPAFPYSVFLAPGGAQFNVPQMYWRAIGVSVDRIYSVTYRYNRPYQRPIYPLGQLYMHPPASHIGRFRQLAVAYGARGISWWDWQEAGTREWSAVAMAFSPLLRYQPAPGYAVLRRGWKGDLVVWAQEHLRAAGQQIPVTGYFRSGTLAAVLSFQTAHGLPPTGRIDSPTWDALLRYPAAPVRWRGRRASVVAASARASSSARSGPPSARLPAVRDELAPRGRRR